MEAGTKEKGWDDDENGAEGGRVWLSLFYFEVKGQRRDPPSDPHDPRVRSSPECICINSVLSLFKCSRTKFAIVTGTASSQRTLTMRTVVTEIRG